ncbi:MAG: rhodanese-like domain-containing protein [Thiobacillus sp.]|nr:rhodanese-like domain-containing protein [Thiobacillus sp.]MDP2977476.1 rhodanese-like domain-containing protein [Thiobacillus sp.]
MLKLKLFAIVASIALVSGCAQTPPGSAGAKATESAEGLIRYKHVVDYAYIKPHATLPRDQKASLIVDSRPAARRYDIGHIPGAINIPESQFDKLAPTMLPADKNAEIILYCQGPTCDLSAKSALKAEKLGYTNIKVYEAGIPDWEAKGEPASVSTAFMQKIVAEKADIVLIDSRPARRVQSDGTIPGAINISDTNFDKETDKLPQDKQKEIIFFCQGFACDLSDKSAKKAMALGYKKVRTYAAGYPAWKAATESK